MRRWSEVAERVAATTRTSEKTALLADYFASLDPAGTVLDTAKANYAHAHVLLAASSALASQRAHSRGPYSGKGENSPQPAGPSISAPSRTVMPRNLTRIGIANARTAGSMPNPMPVTTATSRNPQARGAFATAVPNAKLIVLPDVGHMVQYAVPDLVVAEIEAVIGGMARNTAAAAN